jgi:hypothetical protein
MVRPILLFFPVFCRWNHLQLFYSSLSSVFFSETFVPYEICFLLTPNLPPFFFFLVIFQAEVVMTTPMSSAVRQQFKTPRKLGLKPIILLIQTPHPFLNLLFSFYLPPSSSLSPSFLTSTLRLLDRLIVV